MDTSKGSGSEELSDSDLETVVGGAGSSHGFPDDKHKHEHHHEHHKEHKPHEGAPGQFGLLNPELDGTE